MRLFLFVSAAVVIVLLGQICSQFYLPFSQKNYNSRQGISTKITCQGRCVALCSNLIGWRTACYTMKLSYSIDSLKKLFGHWFLKQFNPFN